MVDILTYEFNKDRLCFTFFIAKSEKRVNELHYILLNTLVFLIKEKHWYLSDFTDRPLILHKAIHCEISPNGILVMYLFIRNRILPDE